MKEDFRVYPYRWVVLAAFMLVTILIEVQWLTHAPVARAAEIFYAGQFNPESIFNIDFLSMLYMLVFIVVCIPASYIIDTYGIRLGLGIGSILTAAFSLMKGFGGANFTVVMIAQVGLAVAQPFILNAGNSRYCQMVSASRTGNGRRACCPCAVCRYNHGNGTDPDDGSVIARSSGLRHRH